MIINLAEEYVSYMIIDRLSRIVDRSELYKHILKKKSCFRPILSINQKKWLFWAQLTEEN